MYSHQRESVNAITDFCKRSELQATTCYKNQDRDFFSMNKSERAIWLEYNGETDDGRVPTVEEIGVHQFAGVGVFRSRECKELLTQADIVCTNPPSLSAGGHQVDGLQ